MCAFGAAVGNLQTRAVAADQQAAGHVICACGSRLPPRRSMHVRRTAVSSNVR